MKNLNFDPGATQEVGSATIGIVAIGIVAIITPVTPLYTHYTYILEYIYLWNSISLCLFDCVGGIQA